MDNCIHRFHLRSISLSPSLSTRVTLVEPLQLFHTSQTSRRCLVNIPFEEEALPIGTFTIFQKQKEEKRGRWTMTYGDLNRKVSAFWPVAIIIGSILGGLAFGFLGPMFGTFKAVGEGKTNQFRNSIIAS
ncbi:hypothetical protein L1887_19700 [Cichorium endivia]|nr:hypothetical protein L1887_19700 [Cichorium endivia]